MKKKYFFVVNDAAKNEFSTWPNRWQPPNLHEAILLVCFLQVKTLVRLGGLTTNSFCCLNRLNRIKEHVLWGNPDKEARNMLRVGLRVAEKAIEN